MLRNPDQVKAQPIRLVDVFILGPFMIWSGMNAKTIPKWAQVGLVIAGTATIVYNGSNFLQLAKGNANGIAGNH